MSRSWPYFAREWFVFGKHPDGKTVDISDGEYDVMLKVPTHLAGEICRIRNEQTIPAHRIWLEVKEKVEANWRCPECGYTEEDKRIHGDHHLCEKRQAMRKAKNES